MNVWRCVMDDIGSRIRQLRKKRGWTANDLADRAEVSQAMVSHLETNKREGSRDVINKIADALGVSSGLLLDPHIPIDKLEQISYILRELQSLSSEQADVIRHMIATLKSSR